MEKKSEGQGLLHASQARLELKAVLKREKGFQGRHAWSPFLSSILELKESNR